MELLQLRYFCRAAETQNFTKTASEFLVPVSNISQTIRKLETELGIKLFDRHGNSVTLNQNGALFYSYISKAVASIEEARLVLKERTGDISGKISILALANRDMVSQCLTLFHKLYPHVELTLETSLEKKGFHSFDLIVSGEDQRLNDYQKTLLLDDTFMGVVSSKSEYAHQHAMTKEQLQQEEFITLAKSISFNSALQRLGEQLDFTPAIMIVSEDPYYIIKYVEVGLGIAYIPSKTWKNRLSPGVKLLPVAGLSLQRQTYLYHNPRLPHSKASEHFVKMLINLSSGL